MSEYKPIKSRRGVYYDLTKSPYEYKSPYGDLFKFSSKKKLEIYTRDIVTEVEKVEKSIQRNELARFLPKEIHALIMRTVYKALYSKIEG